MKNIAEKFPTISLEQRRKLLSFPEEVVDAVLDTDTFNEVDDQFALAFAMLSPEKLNMRAITAAPFFNDRSESFGDGMEKSYDEICRVLSLLDKDPKNFAFKGSKEYLTKTIEPIESDAAKRIVELAREAKANNKRFYILSIAAPTNVASALLMAPDIIENTVVVWLGGHAFYTGDNMEFNLYQDVYASQVLFESGVPMISIPCRGVAENLYTTLTILEKRCSHSGKLGKFLYERSCEVLHNNILTLNPIWDISTVGWFVVNDAYTHKIVSTPIINDDCSWTITENRHEMVMVTHISNFFVFRDLFERFEKFAKNK